MYGSAHPASHQHPMTHTAASAASTTKRGHLSNGRPVTGAF